MRNRKQPLPRYYGKNIAQHAQRKFLEKWAAEHPEQAKKKTVPENEAYKCGRKM